MIPKLLLQPLAENAFKYGFSDRTEDGVLEIKGLRKNGLIYFTVRNNGAGMPPDQLKSVRKSLMAPGYSTMGVGLPNIGGETVFDASYAGNPLVNALCVGVLFEYLAANPELQPQLVALPDPELDAAIDEILRIDDPFPANRRRTTCPVRIGGADIPADAVVKLHWTSANRDEAVVGAPNRFDPARNAEHNLVYGIGKHVCPGRPLATMQLRILLRVTLDHRRILPADTTPEREVAPVGGFRRVPVLVSAP